MKGVSNSHGNSVFGPSRLQIMCVCVNLPVGILQIFSFGKKSINLKILKRYKGFHWSSVSGGRWPFGAYLNGQCLPCRPLWPWLQLPTQSQMADRYLKVSNLKLCVQNAKLFFTSTSELWNISELQKFFFKDSF